tara:strand:+ start:623 stop:1147 length:525 start_codon:yes stop_codon:yes gene_type:complete
MGDIRCPDCGTVNNEFVSASRVNGIERKSYTCKPCAKIFKLISDKTPKELEADEKFDEYVSEVNSTNPDLRLFPSGATRSNDAESERYDLCPPLWAKADATIMAEGAITHGDDNWKKGIPIHVCLNHLERHLNLYKNGDKSEDHLAKVRVNAGFIMYFEELEKIKSNTGTDNQI